MFWRKKKRKVTQVENRKLEEFGVMYMGLLDKMVEKMKDKSTNEVMDIMDIANRLEKKDCWFAVFRVKELIKSAGRKTLKERTPKLKIDEIMKHRHITEKDLEKKKKIEIEEEIETEEIGTEEQISEL
jgi:hypothetical protein